MKVVKIVFGVMIILFAILVIGVTVFIKTLDINRFKGQIQGEISKVLQKEVSIKNLAFKFSLQRGVTLTASGLAIKDDPDFSDGNMFYVDTAHFVVDVLPFITNRQIYVQTAELHSPSVEIMRDGQGQWNFMPAGQTANAQAAGKSQQEGGIGPGKENAARPSEAQPGEQLSFGELLVRSIRITDGTVVLTDRFVNPEIRIPVEQLDVQITNLSLNEAFPVKVAAALWSRRPNIDIKGQIQVNLTNTQVRVDDLKFTTDLSDLDMAQMNQSIPALKEAGLKDGIQGALEIEVAQMVAGAQGLLALAGEGHLSGVKMAFTNSPVPVDGLEMHWKFSETDLDIIRFGCPLASGDIVLSGKIIEYLTNQTFSIQMNIKNVDVGELSEDFELPAKVTGTVNGQFTGKGNGFDLPQIESNLTGDGNLELSEGRILDVNILQMVLSKISFIPNLVAQIEQNLPERYKDKLKQKDTVLEQFTIEAGIRGGLLQIESADLQADGFIVKANGAMDFQQNLDLKADLYIAADLSESMLKSSSELNYFLDDQKRIHIPFKPYQGPLAKFMMYPDVEDIGKTIIQNRGKEELEKVLRKALDVKEEETPVQPAGTGTAPETEPEEASPEEVLIENILNAIPVFK